ncbi:MAG: right-handed parallel beta-helix repeat-containing protein, partial [Anaerolineaceae bacterium]|nr:right-handed parallel beta-helix repeat-containing protein [Anaerolineaceae bacterium]
GGWDGVSDPGSLVIDPDQYVSILDGQNARRVVTADSIIGTPRLSGFTIKNGNADGLVAGCTASEPAGCGGGIFISNAALTIENCIIEHNVAATTYASGAYYGYGGGIYIQNPTGVTITDSIIRSNYASTGQDPYENFTGYSGGIYVSDSVDPDYLTITNNEISYNEAAVEDQLGWGVALTIKYSSGLVSHNNIHHNNLNDNSRASGLYSYLSDITIHDNQIVDNMGTDGEAVYLSKFNGVLTSNIIINPESDDGVYLNLNVPGEFSILDNNIIAQHTIANVRLEGAASFECTANLYHNTLDGAPYGIYLDTYANSTTADCIISNHSTAGIYKNPSGSANTINIGYILFHNNGSDGEWDSSHPLFYGDPDYTDATNRDYHIRFDSAARDRSPGSGYAYDFDGDLRPFGSGTTAFDVGADEYINTAPEAVTDSYATGLNTPLSVDASSGVLSNDTDVDLDTLTAVLVTSPAASQGVLSLSADGSFTFTPAAGFTGDASFTYSASDGIDSSPATPVTITVSGSFLYLPIIVR